MSHDSNLMGHQPCNGSGACSFIPCSHNRAAATAVCSRLAVRGTQSRRHGAGGWMHGGVNQPPLRKRSKGGAGSNHLESRSHTQSHTYGCNLRPCAVASSCTVGELPQELLPESSGRLLVPQSPGPACCRLSMRVMQGCREKCYVEII